MIHSLAMIDPDILWFKTVIVNSEWADVISKFVKNLRFIIYPWLQKATHKLGKKSMYKFK